MQQLEVVRITKMRGEPVKNFGGLSGVLGDKQGGMPPPCQSWGDDCRSLCYPHAVRHIEGEQLQGQGEKSIDRPISYFGGKFGLAKNVI